MGRADAILARCVMRVALLTIAPLLAGCRPPATAPQEGDRPLGVMVGIDPQAFLVDRIGGQRVRVGVLVGPGQSPHVYEPTPRQMSDVSAARALFITGLEFEQRLVGRVRSLAPRVEIVDLRQGLTLRVLTGDEVCLHEHGSPDDHHHHGAYPDPHVWLDPRAMITQARTIHGVLSRLDPDGRETFDAGLAELESELTLLHERLAAKLAPVAGREMFVFHPAFGYLADAYGLSQVPVEQDGKSPSARHVMEVSARMRQSGASVLFTDPQTSQTTVRALAQELACDVVVLHTLSRDYISSMDEIGRRIRDALLPQGEPQ